MFPYGVPAPTKPTGISSRSLPNRVARYRPTEIRVWPHPAWQELIPHLAGLNINCVETDRLDTASELLEKCLPATAGMRKPIMMARRMKNSDSMGERV